MRKKVLNISANINIYIYILESLIHVTIFPQWAEYLTFELGFYIETRRIW